MRYSFHFTTNALIRLLILFPIFLFTFCNQRKATPQSTIPISIVDTLTRQFDTPEALIDCYYKAMLQGNVEQIAICLGLNSTFGLHFTKLTGIKYKIVSMETIQDSIFTNIINEQYQTEGVWKHPDYFLRVETYFNNNIKPELMYYWVGKELHSWIILSHSSQTESEMQDNENEASENATRMMNSIQNRYRDLKNK
jgi:hypothetical protein